jgi:hypothetical protein
MTHSDDDDIVALRHDSAGLERGVLANHRMPLVKHGNRLTGGTIKKYLILSSLAFFGYFVFD